MRQFSVIRGQAPEVNPETGYFQHEKQNFAQLGADSGRFREDQDFRNLRESGHFLRSRSWPRTTAPPVICREESSSPSQAWATKAPPTGSNVAVSATRVAEIGRRAPTSSRKGTIVADRSSGTAQATLARKKTCPMLTAVTTIRPTAQLASRPVKRCGSCELTKPLSEFHRRGPGHQTWCKACRRTYDRDYHRRTRPIRLAQKRLQHRRISEWYRELKSSTPCADCGRTFHHAAMSWDHLPGHVKVDDVSSLVSRHNRSLILAEIAKCELVCANCHAVRSYERRGVAQPG